MKLDSDTAKTRLWLKSLFTEYYSRSPAMTAPEDIHRREFGFGSFGKKITVRHRSFENVNALWSYIKKEAPAHVNHSISRYRFPASEMEDKEPIGSDLIFDIDVGDLKLPCAKEHGTDWVCEDCLTALKSEIIKLKEFMEDDFGFSENEMTINFSGSRGYHLRIENERVRDLDEGAKKQIVSYLSFDIDPSELITERGVRLLGPKPDNEGLKGRVAKAVMAELEKDESLNTDFIISQIKQGNWGAFPKGYGLKRIWNYAKKAAISIPLDAKVTTDPSHLIRMPNTLHGGSALKAAVTNDIDSFEPFRDCVVWGSEEIVIKLLKDIPEISIGESDFQSMRIGEQKVPQYLGAYLLAKGFATIP